VAFLSRTKYAIAAEGVSQHNSLEEYIHKKSPENIQG
jgi:hypothetical protein